MGHVLGQSARLTAVGIAIGLVGTAAGARARSGMLFDVAPPDPSTFIIVSVAFVVVTTLAAYLPARRAALRIAARDRSGERSLTVTDTVV